MSTVRIILLLACLSCTSSFFSPAKYVSNRNVVLPVRLSINTADTNSKIGKLRLTTHTPNLTILKNDHTKPTIKGQPNIKTLFEISIGESDRLDAELLRSSVVQKTTGSVPRSQLPAAIILSTVSDKTHKENSVFSVIEESIKWYLDNGGRISRLTIAAPESSVASLMLMGYQPVTPENLELNLESNELDFNNIIKEGLNSNFILRGDPLKLMSHCRSRLEIGHGDSHTLYDIIGRLQHDGGDPKSAIKSYTSALMASGDKKPAGTFRNLGSAYHANGDFQLAFASYQQAVQLDATDGGVYLKLAFFYEDLSSKDWDDASEHAQKCYEYYLENVDPEDTSVLTRFGNMLVREHKSEDAIKAYKRALDIDKSIHTIWFNMAHAQIKIGDKEGAARSLQETLSLNPSITAAQHMLKALSEDEAIKAQTTDLKYAQDLFNSYAPTYDEHVKKLLYSAPRVIRQELSKIYKANNRFHVASETPQEEEHSCTPSLIGTSEGGCSSHTHVTLTSGPLEILDLGCGTGLAGAWLKDYAQRLVGVDLSAEMIKVAKKKQLYQDLKVMSIGDFLSGCSQKYDLVVAADVLSYIGDLTSTFKQIAAVMKPDSHFAFTVESVSPELQTEKGFRLLSNGRFGYGKRYIDGAIASTSESESGDALSVVMSREFSPRLDAGEPVPGYLYIVEKTVN